MKLLLHCCFLLVSITVFAGASAPTNLPEAVTGNLITVTPKASGLGNNNLTCMLKNRSGREVNLRIPPGLHFKANQDGAQDLFTVRQELLVLQPNEETTLALTGYCMNASNFSPRPNSVYVFKGYASPDLRTLGDSLSRYQSIADGYGQMFVWAITNHHEMYDIIVEKNLTTPATNIMRYVARVANLPLVKVMNVAPGQKGNTLALTRPSVNVFSKRAILAFHNPYDQMATFKVFDDKGKVKHVLFENQLVRHGLKEYTFGINDIIRSGGSPVYFAKVLNANGQVIAQMRVDAQTEEVKTKPNVKNFLFPFNLEKGVKGASLNVYLENGTLVEKFKRYEYLPVGNYNLDVSFMHLYPEDTNFITKLEGPNGIVYAQFPEAKK